MYLIMFVLNDPDKTAQLLDEWEEAGVKGITILHSSGLGRVRSKVGMRDDLPLIPSLSALLQHEEYYSRTLFTVVGDEMVEKVVAATQQVVGDLSRPDTGFLIVLPAAGVYGLDKIEIGS